MLNDSSPRPTTLPRVLGLFDAVMVVVGSVIGSGVFLKARTIADSLPGTPEIPGFWPILSVWILVGLVTLCGSLALAELAAMLPHAGGPYVYLREAFGRPIAFLWGWTEFWIIRTASIGALATASVLAVDTYLTLRGLTGLSHWTQAGLAGALVVGLAIVNIAGTRWGARMQNAATVVKISSIAAIILLPWLSGHANPRFLSTVGEAPEPYSFWSGYAAAVIAVMWAYDGWINISPIAEEIHHPQRNVPLALVFGMLLLIVLYVGANASYHLLLPIGEIAKADVPAAAAVGSVFPSYGGQVAVLAIVISTFGAVNSNMLTGPRIYFAVARDGLLPRALFRIHHRCQTPANAIAIQTAWTIILIAAAFAWTARGGRSPRDAFDTLTNYAIFGGMLFYAMAVAAVFVLRAKRPELPRPYRTWGYPVTPALYLIAFTGFLASILTQYWQESAAGSVVILAGAIFYTIVARRAHPATGPPEHGTPDP